MLAASAGMRLASVLSIAIVPACATSPLQERLAEPDVAVNIDCTGGSTEAEIELPWPPRYLVLE